MKRLSLIIPCYNEALSLPVLVRELEHTLAEIPDIEYEILFVDDGSSDDSLEVIETLAAAHPFVRYISFSRNFGKESAIVAGFGHVCGDYVAVMDADMQDPPKLLPAMLKAVTDEGYECAGARRVNRKGEPPIRSFFARLFYCVINMISDVNLVDGARDYKLLSRKAVDALLRMPEYNRFSKGMYEWIGFKTKWIEYENVERVAGESKWSFWKLFKYSLEAVFSFSTVPLSLAFVMGLAFLLGSLAMIVFLILREYLYHVSAYGWTSLVCLILFVCGVQLFCLGIIGQYLAKTYLEVKRRPHYIVEKQNLRQ